MAARAYYNEIDEKCCAWLRELMKRGLIADGDIDNRSIRDVRPEDLRGYTQCHFFAGIGVWSHALRLAGWPDDRPVWTGSCPCQPFSVAGKRKGTADDRHLWPNFLYLIDLGRPSVVLGEQVASKDGRTWLSTVRTDLEAVGYAVGAADLCAAGIGAPHIRQRLYWGAQGLEYATSDGWQQWRPESGRRGAAGGRGEGRLADVPEQGRRAQQERANFTDRWSTPKSGRLRDASRLADSGGSGLEVVSQQPAWGERSPIERGGSASGLANANGWDAGSGRQQRGGEHGQLAEDSSIGFWADCDWLPCSDGVSRPVEPGSFPLVNGSPARVGRLRGYGNAIVPQVAAAFIEAFAESCQDG